jgi:hypothetical protein
LSCTARAKIPPDSAFAERPTATARYPRTALDTWGRGGAEGWHPLTAIAAAIAGMNGLTVTSVGGLEFFVASIAGVAEMARTCRVAAAVLCRAAIVG